MDNSQPLPPSPSDVRSSSHHRSDAIPSRFQSLEPRTPEHGAEGFCVIYLYYHTHYSLLAHLRTHGSCPGLDGSTVVGRWKEKFAQRVKPPAWSVNLATPELSVCAGEKRTHSACHNQTPVSTSLCLVTGWRVLLLRLRTWLSKITTTATVFHRSRKITNCASATAEVYKLPLLWYEGAATTIQMPRSECDSADKC